MLRLLSFLLLATLLAGCGVRPVTGGTQGSLKTGTVPIPDMQVAVYERAGNTWRQIGFGVTTSDGTFELVQNGAAGPLVLAAGEYRFTLESAGAPVRFASKYARSETTPLVITWPTANERLDLVAPIQITQ